MAVSYLSLSNVERKKGLDVKDKEARCSGLQPSVLPPHLWYQNLCGWSSGHLYYLNSQVILSHGKVGNNQVKAGFLNRELGPWENFDVP